MGKEVVLSKEQTWILAQLGASVQMAHEQFVAAQAAHRSQLDLLSQAYGLKGEVQLRKDGDQVILFEDQTIPGQEGEDVPAAA